MIKPNALKKGDKIAIVSLSWGGLGDAGLIHKYYIAKDRLEKDFGLTVVTMPNALKGTDFVYNHPELRAQDLMEAFCDKSIKGIFCAIGGSDSIRLLPYIDYDVIHDNPKIFMGYSDTTVSHFVMRKAGIVSYYGPSVMCEFGEYVKMWKEKILLIETSEDKAKPDYILYYLRNLGAQGILQEINGIIVGKPQDEVYYEEYKKVYKKIVKEFNCEHLGIIYNVNIGHAAPMGLLPLGIEYQIDLDNKKICFKESGVNI